MKIEVMKKDKKRRGVLTTARIEVEKRTRLRLIKRAERIEVEKRALEKVLVSRPLSHYRRTDTRRKLTRLKRDLFYTFQEIALY